MNYSYRYRGRSVRPVRDRENVIETPFVAAMVGNYTDVTAIIKTYVASPGAEITERGFYYGTNPEPAETDNKVVLGSEIGYIILNHTQQIAKALHIVRWYRLQHWKIQRNMSM